MASIYWVSLLLVLAVWSQEAPKSGNIGTDTMLNLDMKGLRVPNEEWSQYQYSKDDLQQLGIGTETIKKCQDQAKLQARNGNQSASNFYFHYCVMSEKWFRSVPGSGTRYRRTFKELYNRFKFDRFVDATLKKYDDCCYNEKERFVIKVPGHNECYWIDAKLKPMELFNFWSYAGPDLSYMYDFVFYSSQYIHAKENHLWYLVAYIRELLLQVADPELIVKYVKERSQYAVKLLDVKTRLDILERTVDMLFADGEPTKITNMIIAPTGK